MDPITYLHREIYPIEPITFSHTYSLALKPDETFWCVPSEQKKQQQNTKKGRRRSGKNFVSLYYLFSTIEDRRPVTTSEAMQSPSPANIIIRMSLRACSQIWKHAVRKLVSTHPTNCGWLQSHAAVRSYRGLHKAEQLSKLWSTLTFNERCQLN